MLKTIIKKGNKRISTFQQLTKFFRFYINKKSVAYNVIFSKSCLYDSEKIAGVNKLFGLTFGLGNVHKTSVRFGWQPNKNNKIEIYAYYYDFDGRKEMLIGEVEAEVLCKLKIEINDNEYVLTCNELKKVINHGKISKLSYLNFIYFGGLNTSPQDIEIYVEKA